MREKIRDKLRNVTFASRIRSAFVVFLIPVFILVTFSFYSFWVGNQKYEQIIDSIATASEFNLDFKKDYDYETYLVIVGDTSPDDSKLDDLLKTADSIIIALSSQEQPAENKERLERVSKYLINLKNYQDKIKLNLIDANGYEDNMEIWEKDVQIVTSLIQEEIYKYTFDEARDLQVQRLSYQKFYLLLINLSVIMMILIGVWIIILMRYIPQSISQPINELSRVTDRVAKGDLTVRADVDGAIEINTLSSSLNQMIERISILIEQVRNEQESLRKAEFNLLQAQIKPHFLYNTLDTIVWLAEAGDQSRVIHLVKSLSDFFRTSLSQGRDVITLKEELTHVRSYLEIQQVRYQDILTYEIDVPDELYSCIIPKITIQPLVENALYHGIKGKRGMGTVTITGFAGEGFYIVTVKDDGVGMSEEKLSSVTRKMKADKPDESEAFGLYNINERIKLYFGEDYGISISSREGEGTTVRILLPASE